MDHFALPDDELARAQARGGLHRNFMGYTTHADSDLIGLGVSAISHIGDSFSQNPRDLISWQGAIDDGRPAGVPRHAPERGRPTARGPDPGLMCQGEIRSSRWNAAIAIDFNAYFADSLERLQPLAADRGWSRSRPKDHRDLAGTAAVA